MELEPLALQIQVHPPPTPTVHPPPSFAVHHAPTSAVHPRPTPTTEPLPPPVIITLTPPSDPTSIPSSSSRPPSKTVTPSADLDSTGDDDGVDSPLHDRPWIEPYGKGFLPSRVSSQVITRSIKQQYLSPWPTWGAIPKDDRNPFWERFKAQALGRAVHVDEVFAQTHVRKGTNEFVGERSRKTHVKSEHRSAPTPDDTSNAEDDIRQLAANYTTSRGGTLKHQSSFSTTTADEAIVRLTQALEQRNQEIIDLIAEFTNFMALVMSVLPQTGQD
ncbi:max-binding protein MNT-like [Vigna radiata var. radiata]|uniref:Max-binding protein MNT-like n=1 Tax=Vigna radiata var. radiata TaxID=3916 RepID=A0A1S3V0H4_VIGRR|nr:max-binding protein MNT-like [Vigna radiata var. radiata]